MDNTGWLACNSAEACAKQQANRDNQGVSESLHNLAILTEVSD